MPVPAEVVNSSIRRGPFRAALFDFDGTLSLIREGWPRIMVGMMVDHLRAMGLVREPEPALWVHLDHLVMELNGAPTIRQMEVFTEEVRRRAGMPAEAEVYLAEYTGRLMIAARERWRGLESVADCTASWVVPDAHAILANLRDRGVVLHVASGTDYAHVAHEAHLLEIDSFFPCRINAPRDNSAAFAKADVIARVLAEGDIRGQDLIGFGDGVVETREVKRAGGVAVGVASSEPGTGRGIVNAEKRARLIAAGADLIVPDYSEQEELVRWLWNEV